MNSRAYFTSVVGQTYAIIWPAPRGPGPSWRPGQEDPRNNPGHGPDRLLGDFTPRYSLTT